MDNLALVFAIARNGVIGHRGALPWDYPEDREHFHRTTAGHAVIMGRRTWEESGEALPDRTNIVVSSELEAPEGVIVARSLDEALRAAWRVDEEPFVIGGVRLFEEALPRATRLVVTEIPRDHAGDTVFHFDRRPFRIISSRTGDLGLVFEVLEPDLNEVAPTDPAATALVARYFEELRRHIPDFEPPPSDAGDPTLVANESGVPVACATLRPFDAATVEVKRMFVLPEARGRGHARRLLFALERKARALGAKRIVLDTAAPLADAVRLYLSAGYEPIAPYNENRFAAHWFEKRL